VSQGTPSETPTGGLDGSKLWGKPQYEMMMNVMEEQVNLGNASGKGTFTKIGWNNIVNTLQAAFGKEYTKDRIRGRYNRDRPSWRKFKRLKEQTGIGFDPTIGLVTMEPELWDRLDKVIIGCKAKFMGKPFVYHRQWSVIDQHREATGAYAQPSTLIPESVPESSTRLVPVVLGDDDIDIDELVVTPAPKRKKKKEETLIKAMYDFMSVIAKTTERRDDKIERTTQSVVCAFNKSGSKLTPQMKTQESRSDEANSPPKKRYDEFLHCTDILETLEGVDGEHYTKAVMVLEKSEALRKFFLRISDDRKVTWTMNL